MPDKNKEEKAKSRVGELLIGLGLASLLASGGVATYMGIWDTHKTIEAAKGKDVDKIKDKQKEKKYCGKIKNPETGKTFYRCTDAKLEEVKAGVLSGVPIEKFCGTESEKLENCPEWPLEETSACCCVPPEVVVDDCFCGSKITQLNPETQEQEEVEIFDKSNHGLLCRSGKHGDNQDCDPQDSSLNCVVWPMTVMAGENPGDIAKQKTDPNEGQE